MTVQPIPLSSATEQQLPPAQTERLEELQQRTSRTVAGSLSPATLRSYRTGWRQWQEWAEETGVPVMPAVAETVAAWAQHLHDKGMKADSVAVRLAAVSYAHQIARRSDGQPVENPVNDQWVKLVLRGLRKTDAANGVRRRQAKPLSDADIARIEAIAPLPRPLGSRRVESETTAAKRACWEIAVVRLLRDGLLRISEVAAALWEDLQPLDDGSATLHIRRSKTDQLGEGAEVWLSPATYEALLRLQAQQASDPANTYERIVGDISLNTVTYRLDKAFRYAGLGAGYSGHSGRVGMAQDLAANGAGLTAIMTAGRWKSSGMPARYAERQSAQRGAVADWYRNQGGGT